MQSPDDVQVVKPRNIPLENITGNFSLFFRPFLFIFRSHLRAKPLRRMKQCSFSVGCKLMDPAAPLKFTLKNRTQCLLFKRKNVCVCVCVCVCGERYKLIKTFRKYPLPHPSREEEKKIKDDFT